MFFCLVFRWFKFTLKPPYRIAIGNFFSAIWDTLEFICQIWTQDSLWHLLGPFLVNFGICQFLATPGLFEYFGQNGVPSENLSFLNKGAATHQNGMGVLGGQMTRLYDGTIFGGVRHTRGPLRAVENKGSVFWHICDSLKGTRDSPISSRFRP